MMAGRHITDAEYATALEEGRRAAETEFRAQAVSYLPERDAIEVITVRNGGFIIPRRLVGALQDASPSDLGTMEMWPDGSIIEIESLDIHVSVHDMIKAALPALVPRHIMASMFAAKGGAVKSMAKTQSSRENGRKGGRPATKKVA
jgi:hypothetical protein